MSLFFDAINNSIMFSGTHKDHTILGYVKKTDFEGANKALQKSKNSYIPVKATLINFTGVKELPVFVLRLTKVNPGVRLKLTVKGTGRTFKVDLGEINPQEPLERIPNPFAA